MDIRLTILLSNGVWIRVWILDLNVLAYPGVKAQHYRHRFLMYGGTDSAIV